MKYFWPVVIGGLILYSFFNLGRNYNSSETTSVSPPSVTPNIANYKYTYDEPVDLEFNGYECTGDCSGHEAGYSWAEEKGITDPDDCGGNSQSFIEGCMSYAEENSNEYDSGYDSSEDYLY